MRYRFSIILIIILLFAGAALFLHNFKYVKIRNSVDLWDHNTPKQITTRKEWRAPQSQKEIIHAGEVINRIQTNKKILALTFDADMTEAMLGELRKGKVKSWYNKDVIKELRAENIPATLFLTGLWIQTYPKETEELAKDALFEIGNHSYSHGAFAEPCYTLPKISNERDEYEITETEKLLAEHARGAKKYFRFPGFCYEQYDLETLARHGYIVIHGDVRGGDGFTHDTIGVSRRIIAMAKPGSIIVLHMHGGPNAPITADALRLIIPALRNRGFSFVKVSTLLDE